MYPGTHARTQPDKTAIIQPSTGRSVTYRQLNERSNRLAHYLRSQGLQPGDHVAVFLENHVVMFDLLWACLRSGLYFTPINRHLSANEAAYIVDDCDALALFGSAALAQSEALGQLAQRARIKLAIGGSIPGYDDYETAVADQPTHEIADERLGTLMLYSSGTTGKPKGVLRALPTQKPVEGNPAAQAFSKMFEMDGQTVYLSPAPLYHSAPLGSANAVIQCGGTIIMMDKFAAEEALSLIDQFKFTHSQWVPTMFIRMLKLPADVKAKYDVSSMRYAVHASAPCPQAVKRQMIEWWGPVLWEYYSSTEAAGITLIGSEEWLDHPGSVGRPRGTIFHICDESGTELPPGEAGLIYGEAPQNRGFKYHKDEGKSREATHPVHSNWFTVGDVGYLDAAGYLYLTDRKAFMIISGGVNIYPQQIEDALALHPKLNDVAVIGVPNPDLGEEAKAIVELAPDTSPSEELKDELKAFVTAKLGKQLTPRSIDFVDVLPRMPTGKLNKKLLQAKYWPAA